MTASGISHEPATCRECGNTLSRRNNMRAHYQRVHPELAHLPMAELVTADPPHRRRRATAAATGALVPVTLPAAAPPPVLDLPPLGVEDLDGLVLGVVDQLAGPAGMFPVQHLPALLVWREATAAFLRQVTR